MSFFVSSMGVYTGITGLLGFSVNSLAILVFIKSEKVRWDMFNKEEFISLFFKYIFHCLRHQSCNDLLQLRTPFNWLLMNLSATELVMAVTGNPILAYNSFHGKWCFSETICRINALGMTFLGKVFSFLVTNSNCSKPSLSQPLT